MRILSGIQPSGKLHLGNYFAMMKPALELQGQGEVFLFIADYHALTTVNDPDGMREGTRDVALDFLACGLDPAQTTFYRKQNAIDSAGVAMAVAVQKMVHADCAGVAFTVDPVTRNRYQTTVEAVWGLGEGLVSGSLTPDNYKMDREDFELISEFVSRKEKMYTRGADGMGVVVAVEVDPFFSLPIHPYPVVVVVGVPVSVISRPMHEDPDIWRKIL